MTGVMVEDRIIMKFVETVEFIIIYRQTECDEIYSMFVENTISKPISNIEF